jgi:hypothetical protein
MSNSIHELHGNCDLVEINHCHDPDTHELRYTQLIAWDWCDEYKRYDAQQWVVVSDWKRLKREVVADADNKDEIVRLRCNFFRETWTNYDPERLNAGLFPESLRRKVW